MNRAQLRSKPPKVDGTFISASTHPHVFAANPGLRALAARRGGKLLMDDETLSAFAPSSTAQATAPASDDADAFLDRHFAARRGVPASPAAACSSAPQAPPVPAGGAEQEDTDAAMDRYFASKREAAERMAAARARPRR